MSFAILLTVILLILLLALFPLVTFLIYLNKTRFDGDIDVKSVRKVVIYVVLAKILLLSYLILLTVQGLTPIPFLGQLAAPLFVPIAVGVLWANWYALAEFYRIRKVKDFNVE